ncbi:aspartyl aminopeptidase [Salpingoeca rosetta]|uniref:aspartyl aminopeptidase n=1 Tax=Salpingoeca rosetta (strain ATCC 50818 / BSB-021) TaxID=946362 RepID=F2U7U2_SALR5|nr:aspartyl aminopeptidase [Salpingoeca rosetta]EGD72847.1 aspartyl aminopeptidase [Salpingoeca rosetta]|eukprot:XP_004994670.1 aspartyl aminopeptidase [Salpingoeca rosetta]
MAMDFKASADKFIKFVNASPSPFHAVQASKAALIEAGFKEIRERDAWETKPLGKYFFTRNQSTLVAFAVGGNFKPGNAFTVIGAHTDSPCLKVKPNSKLSKAGYLSVGVECYGGGLWNTWFDRDLSLAGRVMVRQPDGNFAHKLIRVDKPILRVPNLAIHLNRGIYSDGFKYNKETHLPAILAIAEKQLNAPAKGDADKKEEGKKPFSQDGRHHSMLLEIISKELGCEVKDICDFELCLFDTQPSALGGPADEFVLSPRLDNLESSFCGLEGLIAASSDADLKDDTTTRVLALFDHEEVGSDSAQGAGSSLFEHVLRRLSAGRDGAFEEAVPKSYIISSDMAHAIHPNYPEKHEANHQPMMNAGPVIKFNTNQRYATNAVTALILRRVAEIADVPLQDVMVRNDSACGSTIGPILSAGLGIRTIDIGNAQLAMHSIREMGGSHDIAYAVTLFKTFYCKFAEVDASVTVE